MSSLQNKLLQGTIRPLCIRKNHWVAIFVDRENKKVIYFDSVKAGKDSEITSLSNHDIDSKDQYDPNFKISTASDDLKVFHKLMLKAIGQDYTNYKIIRNNTKFQYNGFDCGPGLHYFANFFVKIILTKILKMVRVWTTPSNNLFKNESNRNIVRKISDRK